MARATPARAAFNKQSTQEPFSFLLFLIALFKLFKALLLIAAGIGAIRLLHKDVASTALHWVQVLRVDPDNRYIHGILVRIFRVTPKQLRELSVGTFLYAVARHFTVVKVVVTVINVLIVWYLVARVRSRSKRSFR